MSVMGSSSGNRFQNLQNLKVRPGVAFGIIILTALLAFELFNYSTTDYALRDLLGDLRFAGVRWATILSIAFCGIDFAGIARLFTPEQGADEPKEVWYLFGAWLLAATMNAILTWWGVSMAITNHSVVSSSTVVTPKTLTTIVPVFVAIMVWVIRILIIGSLSYAGERIFSTDTRRKSNYNPARRQPAVQQQPEYSPAMSLSQRPSLNRGQTAGMRQASAARPNLASEAPSPRPEPTYHSLSARPASPRGITGDNHRA